MPAPLHFALVLFGGVVSKRVVRTLYSHVFVRLQRHLVRLMGMLQGLSGMFVPGQVILFSMLLRGGAMSVCGKIVEFSSSSMGIAHTCSAYGRVSIRADLL